jgi:hypothetical protein
MIHYFLKPGDVDVSEMFTPYVWGQNGLGTRLVKELRQEYGSDLKLLLIMYYIEGKFAVNGPEQAKVNSYSNKNKDISVAISVTSKLFHLRNEFERREFIVDSSLFAIQMVEEKLKKRKLQIDFYMLSQDFRIVAQEYLKQSNPLLPTTSALKNNG